eukprot:TRINITY_DN6548_c0_g1_i2.p1 TRINITY_DN6548_c0_g1~~TRINITY_DN6548_c0_g1_i2.p1  ORF type:complete len:659 (-),score=194.85 TRINITY_DN6548_c0_g1_i2:21-1997(-)
MRSASVHFLRRPWLTTETCTTVVPRISINNPISRNICHLNNHITKISTTSVLHSPSNYITPHHITFCLPRLSIRTYSQTAPQVGENEEEPKKLKDQEESGKLSALLATIKKLNEKERYEEVLVRVEQFKSTRINEPIIREYIKAVVKSGKWEERPLKEVLNQWLREPGGSASHPLFVQAQTGRSAGEIFLSMFGTILFVLFLWFLIKSGGMGLVGSGNAKELKGETIPNLTLDAVKGNQEAKEELLDLLDYLKNPAKFANLGVKMPKGVLLVGPPGTGKTLLARALAGEAGVPFFYTSGSEFEEMLVGVGASRIRSLFQKARMRSPCIIFIDEIDAVGGRRDTPENKTKMTLNQLLVELDGFSPSEGVLVVAATNLASVLDPALVRPGRFDRQVHLDLPDRPARKEIIDLYLTNRKAEDVDTDALARGTPGMSGADLFTLVNWAAIEASKNGEATVNMRHLEAAKENVMMGRERKSMVISDSTRKLTAFHEAGHALVALYTPGASVIHKATLVPRGHALGMVQQLSNDDLMYTKQELLAGLDVAMAGRAAEELIFGDKKVTQGAGSDFQQATRKARVMVSQLGMSESVGKVYVEQSEIEHLSQESRANIDREVKIMLDDAYVRAKRLLVDKKEELHRLANALLEYETLSLEDIKLVVN